MLVILRVAIGWHFFYEGIYKLKDPNFTSANYFRVAKGPFAEFYRNQIPDNVGRGRLSLSNLPADKSTPTSKVAFSSVAEGSSAYQEWKNFTAEFKSYYKLDDAQIKKVEDLLAMKKKQLALYLKDNYPEIQDYKAGLQRVAKADTESKEKYHVDPSVAFQQQRIWDWRAELAKTAAPWLGKIDEMGENYRSQLAAVLKEDQASKGVLEPAKTNMQKMDMLVTLATIAIGFCLMTGLFTRLAAFGGACFLALVILAQPALPNIYPAAHPSAGHSLFVNKEVIEFFALVFIATTHVGRWGGLDFIIHNMFFAPKKSTKKGGAA